MTPFAPLNEMQFQHVAMFRARGMTWNDTAEALHLPLELVERLPWTHEKLWNRTLAKAERWIAREALSETVGALRRDVRNGEPQHHATLANSLSRILKLQQDYAPKKRRRVQMPPTTTPRSPISPTVAVPEMVPPAVAPKPPDLPPPTPKMSTDEMIALKKRIRARIAGAACALLAFVCLCALWFGRVLPTGSTPTVGPAVLLTEHAPLVATATPEGEHAASPLAASWRAPPRSFRFS